MYICKHTADTRFKICRSRRTPSFRSILIEAVLQSLRIRGNPRCLLCIIQIHLAMPWVEPQIISLVEQSLHNMHMYSMLHWFPPVSRQKIEFYQQ